MQQFCTAQVQQVKQAAYIHTSSLRWGRLSCSAAGEDDDDDNDGYGTHQTWSCRSNKQKSVSQLVSQVAAVAVAACGWC